MSDFRHIPTVPFSMFPIHLSYPESSGFPAGVIRAQQLKNDSIFQEVANSPYSVMVTPEDAYGPASVAYGNGLSAAVATLENAFYVQASAVVALLSR